MPNDDGRETPEEFAARWRREQEKAELQGAKDSIGGMRVAYGLGGAAAMICAVWKGRRALDGPWYDLAAYLSFLGLGLFMLMTFGVSIWRGRHMSVLNHSFILKRCFVLAILAELGVLVVIALVKAIRGD